MKRRITLSIALVLIIVLVSLTSSDSTAEAQNQAQNQIKVVADTGFIPLGPNQELRVTVAAGDVNGDDNTYVQFKQLKYIQTTCGNGVCKNEKAVDQSSPKLLNEKNESFSVNSEWSASISGTRVIVSSNNRNLRVNMIIFDTSTQRAISSSVDVVDYISSAYY